MWLGKDEFFVIIVEDTVRSTVITIWKLKVSVNFVRRNLQRKLISV